MPNSENNKRIAKNTILLYFRMLLTMGVSLYTSRIILNTLGVEDFGIYNVVGGVVTMLGFLNSSMASATQRFLSFELGKNDLAELKRIFSMSINIHAIIAVFIFILAETIGLWFLNTKLVIPIARMEAANWVYQFSIFSFILSVMGVPYNAAIIAHERMNIYAWVSILEVVLKLILVFSLVTISYDKLKIFSIFIFGVSVVIWNVYKIYSNRNFKETHYHFFWDKSLYHTLLNYAGWNIFGNLSAVAYNQGINILLNIFFGPAVNAARGIAYQVNGTVNGFISNFQMSMNPQIVKSYAANNHVYMQQLIFRGAKYSFFLLYFLTLPILLQTSTILHWWLKIVPDYASLFCQLVLIDALINCISGPLMTTAQATGTIKKYQAIVGGVLLLNLPMSYLFLKLGYPPQFTFYVSICITFIALFLRLLIIQTLLDFSTVQFLKQVVLKVILVTFISLPVPLLLLSFIDNEISRFFLGCLISSLSIAVMIYFFGLTIEEKKYFYKKVSTYLKFGK